jgi:hypothetical protein
MFRKHKTRGFHSHHDLPLPVQGKEEAKPHEGKSQCLEFWRDGRCGDLTIDPRDGEGLKRQTPECPHVKVMIHQYVHHIHRKPNMNK